MDLTMGIASLSVSMNQSQLQQDIGIAVLKKAMNSDAASADTLLKDLMDSASVQSEQLAAQPYLGGNVDIAV